MTTPLVILFFLGALAVWIVHASSAYFFIPSALVFSSHFAELLLDLDVLPLANLLSMVFGKDRRLSVLGLSTLNWGIARKHLTN